MTTVPFELGSKIPTGAYYVCWRSLEGRQDWESSVKVMVVR